MNAIANVGQFKQALTHFEGQISTVARQLAVSLPSHISIEKFQRTLMAAVKADPELLKADRASLINACEKAALDGLLPDKREAALVIFKRNFKDAQGQWRQVLEVAYMPMVYGLRKKILQSGEVTDITAKVVYRREVEEGHFIYEEGTEAMLRHKPLLDLNEKDAADANIVVAYSIATYKDGSKSYEVMRRFEIDKVRECSQTGATRDRKGQPRRPSGPWVDWYPEQAKKTVMRRHSKTLPMSGDLMIDVEGRELETVSHSTERMLSVQPDAPKVLPSAEQLDEHVDPETGEVITDSRGMTETDEATARRLDAGEDANDGTLSQENPTAAEGPADEQRGEAPNADFVGIDLPKGAQHGQTWYNPETGVLKYAHDKGKHGIKWYMQPPAEEDQAEVAAQTLRDIDGKDEDQSDEPMWKGKLDGLRAKLAKSATLKAVEGVERDWLNLIRPAVDDESVVAAFEHEIADRKRAIKAEG
jgi:recombination protein RecT